MIKTIFDSDFEISSDDFEFNYQKSLTNKLDSDIGNFDQNKLNEIDVEEKLLELRKNEERFISPSFNTIAGTGSNGAIVHYKANHTSCKNLKAGDLLLVDSGGQYLDGTTDVTRTVALFPNEKTIQKEKKDRFTRVLKGHIAIACSVFKKGTSGKDLDPYARKYLIEEGLDYKHGTGHGVGSFLGVHEGPQSISPLGVQEIKEGMIISNEPLTSEQEASPPALAPILKVSAF